MRILKVLDEETEINRSVFQMFTVTDDPLGNRRETKATKHIREQWTLLKKKEKKTKEKGEYNFVTYTLHKFIGISTATVKFVIYPAFKNCMTVSVLCICMRDQYYQFMQA